MSDLPAIKYLDMAAKAAGFSGWGGLNTHYPRGHSTNESARAHAHALEEADRLREALAKYEPEPVDEDGAAVSRILVSFGCDPRPLSEWKTLEDFKFALAQYKAERPTIADDEALLIAREIAAKFASNFSWVIAPSDCCKGEMDHTNAQKFALAMVKRDPAALEAFRGVGRG